MQTSAARRSCSRKDNGKILDPSSERFNVGQVRELCCAGAAFVLSGEFLIHCWAKLRTQQKKAA
jgi:hypothetical protein